MIVLTISNVRMVNVLTLIVTRTRRYRIAFVKTAGTMTVAWRRRAVKPVFNSV